MSDPSVLIFEDPIELMLTDASAEGLYGDALEADGTYFEEGEPPMPTPKLTTIKCYVCKSTHGLTAIIRPNDDVFIRCPDDVISRVGYHDFRVRMRPASGNDLASELRRLHEERASA